MRRLVFCFNMIVSMLLGLAGSPARAQDFKAILASPDRPANELALDASRRPEEVLRFFGVKSKDKVADLMAGRGYYTVLLSKSVGNEGLVYSAVPRARNELKERLKDPAYGNVRLLEGEMEKVALPEDGSLDFVLIHLNYHDLRPDSRAGMNRRVFAALRPGGVYGIVDHYAQDGVGPEAAGKLHRIEKGVVIQEATAAGFALAQEGEMLRRPEDPRTETVFRVRGKSDRFVLKFEKPGK